MGQGLKGGVGKTLRGRTVAWILSDAGGDGAQAGLCSGSKDLVGQATARNHQDDTRLSGKGHRGGVSPRAAI